MRSLIWFETSETVAMVKMIAVIEKEIAPLFQK